MCIPDINDIEQYLYNQRRKEGATRESFVIAGIKNTRQLELCYQRLRINDFTHDNFGFYINKNWEIEHA